MHGATIKIGFMFILFEIRIQELNEYGNYIEHNILCVYWLALFIAETVCQVVRFVSAPRDNQ
jgi:surface polysaccharide O-acyltransferase-like enzyme